MVFSKKINVAIVIPPISGHKLRGVGVYSEELYKAINKDGRVNIEKVELKKDISRFDVVHYPYFDPFFLTLPVFKIRPTIVTVHDLIPFKYPSQFPKGVKGELKWLIQKYSLQNSSAIITDSYTSKKDIIHYGRIDEEKVNIIYLGVRKEFKLLKSTSILNQIRKKYNLPSNFILYVGDVNYNKNITGIIRTFAKIVNNLQSLGLVLVGNGFINNSLQLSEILTLISELGLNKKILRLGYVEIHDLAAIYNLAKIYLQPSFAEGFGLPIVEAMACGCPVIVSNTSSLPEITHDAATLVNPANIDDIVNAVIKVVKGKILREEFIQKGLERVKLFTWDNCASQTIKVYKEVLR
ncbi:glycosyltransferase family 4 protein [Candidatus Gottesmanbacteria bacterium]|nr:glycosyltransferase family 4 protein [Candidatus Gottesmanbacteria bacterium]